MTRLIACATCVMILCTMLLVGCGVDSAALDDAYARGYADGVASVEEELPQADSPYWVGYQDGLADAENDETQDACQRCYGQGFSDGYQAGVSTATESS